MNLQKAVALRISQLLIKNKTTRYSLCKQVFISEQALEKILSEKNKNIHLSTIAKLSKGFNISLSEFFEDELFNQDNIELF